MVETEPMSIIEVCSGLSSLLVAISWLLWALPSVQAEVNTVDWSYIVFAALALTQRGIRSLDKKHWHHIKCLYSTFLSGDDESLFRHVQVKLKTFFPASLSKTRMKDGWASPRGCGYRVESWYVIEWKTWKAQWVLGEKVVLRYVLMINIYQNRCPIKIV